MISNPAVSAVIPCFNGGKYLQETLESVLSQTHPPIEVIVVDDGSTDDSATIANSFGPLVRVIQQPNQGESVARNRGMDEARGQWVAFLDADDLWKPEKLATQLSAANSDVDVIHTEVYWFGTRKGESALKDVPVNERYQLRRVATDNTFHPSSLLVRRSVAARFPEWTKWGEDMLFALELVLDSQHTPCLISQPLTGYRYHGGSQRWSRLSTWVNVHESVCEWLKRNAHRISDADATFIQEHWNNKLLESLKIAKYRRDWDDYQAIRKRLELFRNNEGVAAALDETIYPRWAYRLKDQLDLLRGLATKRDETMEGQEI